MSPAEQRLARVYPSASPADRAVFLAATEQAKALPPLTDEVADKVANLLRAAEKAAVA